MMDAQGLAGAMGAVAGKIEENKEYLTRLDQLNGDGDLGISMSEGFKAVDMLLEISEEKDLGKLLMKAGNAFNEAAPSSLGTILSFGLTGMAKALKGTREAGGEQIAVALRAGVDKIMEKAGSKPGGADDPGFAVSGGGSLRRGAGNGNLSPGSGGQSGRRGC